MSEAQPLGKSSFVSLRGTELREKKSCQGDFFLPEPALQSMGQEDAHT